jgi:DNA-binding NtrC family response regulator
MTTSLSPCHPAKLVLIDDDPAMVRLLASIIHRSYRHDIEMQPYSDPALAQNYMERELVDIVVTDLEMPEISGLEILRIAKSRNPCAQVLLVTGHSSIIALLEALEHGASDYLLKPVDEASFLQLIGDALARVIRWREALAGTLSSSTSDAEVTRATRSTCPDE